MGCIAFRTHARCPQMIAEIRQVEIGIQSVLEEAAEEFRMALRRIGLATLFPQILR